MKYKSIIKSIFKVEQAKRFFTNQEMADHIDFSLRSYNLLLAGKKRLTLQEANTICGQLDIPLDVLAAAELGSNLYGEDLSRN